MCQEESFRPGARSVKWRCEIVGKLREALLASWCRNDGMTRGQSIIPIGSCVLTALSEEQARGFRRHRTQCEHTARLGHNRAGRLTQIAVIGPTLPVTALAPTPSVIPSIRSGRRQNPLVSRQAEGPEESRHLIFRSPYPTCPSTGHLRARGRGWATSSRSPQLVDRNQLGHHGHATPKPSIPPIATVSCQSRFVRE